MVNSLSGVGVLDKAMAVLTAVEAGPRSLAELMQATGLTRATAHRLAVALEAHGLVRRDDDGRFSLGLRLIGLGHAAAEALPGWLRRPPRAGLAAGADRRVGPAVRAGRRRAGVRRVAGGSPRAAHDRPGRRPPPARPRLGRPGPAPAGPAAGWVESVAERQAGVASVSAPVVDPSGRVIAAVSVSGPIDRLTRSPGRRHGAAVVEAADRIAAALR